jgi:adenine/guanine phosphoribosyltransferase-like PRPP-binding protein
MCSAESAPDGHDDWIRPTTGSWQRFEPASAWAARLDPPYRYGYPAVLEGGRVLVLPIRRLPDAPGRGRRAVASLIANQASLDVADALASAMVELARPLRPDVVLGLPTLGLVFAPGVARGLGHARWVPLGYSRKFWYDEALSANVASITTPTPGKRVYLDPNQLPLLRGARVVIVDDAISSGRTAAAIWDLLERLAVDVVGVTVAMRQGAAWRDALGPRRAALTVGVFDSPLLVRGPRGWMPD